MNIEDKRLIDEIKNIKQNGNKIHVKQLDRRKAFINNPVNAGLLKQVQLGMKIAQAVYNARVSAKLTQKQLAEKLHTRQSYIAEVEKGKRNITIATLERYAEACGKHVEFNLI